MNQTLDKRSEKFIQRLPPWFRQEIPVPENIRPMKSLFRRAGLHTVCESAFCPNMGACWEKKTASFMILGQVCTRACRFCGVKAGRPEEVNPEEPLEVARAIQRLGLRYAVVTSVTRDDLPDRGAGQFAQTITAIKKLTPKIRVEVLIPDFSGRVEHLQKVADAGPDVVSHNIETVRRLSPDIRPRADYDCSLDVLRSLKKMKPPVLVKSGLMVGLGETREEITGAMRDLADAGCDMLTVGQYLAPTKGARHVNVARFVAPEEFELYRDTGMKLGFKHVMSAPLARSSYIAEEGYNECLAVL